MRKSIIRKALASRTSELNALRREMKEKPLAQRLVDKKALNDSSERYQRLFDINTDITRKACVANRNLAAADSLYKNLSKELELTLSVNGSIIRETAILRSALIAIRNLTPPPRKLLTAWLSQPTTDHKSQIIAANALTEVSADSDAGFADLDHPTNSYLPS